MCHTLSDMGKTLTVRIGSREERALARRAAARGTSVSAVVREILEGALDEGPLGGKTAAFRGRLSLPEPKDSWRRQIRARNWRP
jgi:plasmid stability protein